MSSKAVTHDPADLPRWFSDGEAAQEGDAQSGNTAPDDIERVLLDHLSVIRSIVVFVGRSRRLTPHELEEFASHVNLKLIENHYAVFRKFQGRSSLRSYLSVVIQRLYLDWRIGQWGKWRPSSVAKRNGSIAVLLEQLTLCQGLSVDEAQMTLQTVLRVSVQRSVLESLCAQFPARTRRRHSSDRALHAIPASHGDPASGLMAEAERGEAAEVLRFLSAELATLSPGDLRLLKLKFVDGLTIASIARSTCGDAKTLYRRVGRILNGLRTRLLERGVRQAHVRNLLGRIDLTLSGLWAPAHETPAELCRSRLRAPEPCTLHGRLTNRCSSRRLAF